MIGIECKNVTKSFNKNVVLEDVSFQLETGNIYALLGRNGAGKTTLMNCLCTKYLPDSGEIRILGEEAYENEKVLSQICFMSDQVDVFETKKVKNLLFYASTFYEKWDSKLMDRLLDFFEISTKKLYSELSKGQKTVIGIIIGLCSGCEIVMLDEIYSGLDAVARQSFYEILLEEQEKHPRTFLLSTHLIEEMTGLFTNVVLLDKGKIILNEDMDTIYAKAFKCVGRKGQEGELLGKKLLRQKQMGTVTEYDIYDDLTPQEKKALEEKGFTVSALDLQDLFIAFTQETEKEWGGENGAD
jgi:ABC-2 type transport system ATP-binding protein